MTTRRKIGFPLLVKELTELANRKRTYVVRFLYAAVLFVGGLYAIYGTTGALGGDVRLGVGADIFHNLVEMQFWLILIFLPPTASGALTIEKERDSLSLLLLTTMPPWSILLQKYLSRLMPMVSFLLLAFPLLAVAYSYGGVATEELISSIVLLLLFAAEVCAIAILCSARCATTPESLMSTYGLLLVLYMIPPLWPPQMFSAPGTRTGQGLGESVIVVMTCVMVGSVILMSLALARIYLQSRAFVTRRNILLEAFQWLDRLFVSMNRLTGGVVLVNDTNSLPDDRPIAWRETAKKSLGTFRYLFRVCTVLTVPILFVGASINISMVRTNSAMTALLYILWGIAAAMICVHASGVITAERSRQTLDVLLVSPLSGAEILRQKLAGVWRLIAVLFVPFLTIYGFQLWFRGFDVGYLLGSVASAAVFLPTIAWIALAVGLRIRATMKAILTSIGAIVMLCVLPYVLATPINPMARAIVDTVQAMSPIHMIQLLESRGVLHDRTTEATFWLSLVLFVPYGLLCWWVRRDCLMHADRLLQRVVDEAPLAESQPVEVAVAEREESALVSADAV